MRKIWLAGLLVFLAAGAAHAASTTFNFVINSGPSTAVTCTIPPDTQFIAPLAPGTVICAIVVTPASWSGQISQTDPTLAIASSTNGSNLVVGSTALPVGPHSGTITTTP